jgi:hypothetical protein
MRWMSVVGWIVVFGTLFAWQGLSLAWGSPWLTISDVLRGFMRPLLGRWLLFGLWLWLGWHLFIRGWVFFMRSRL